MKRKTAFFAGWLGIVALAVGPVGCGDDDGGDTLPLAQVESSYMQAFCELAIDCELVPMFALFDGDVQACVQYIESSPDADFEMNAIVDSVNAGNTDYDPALGAQCIDTIRSSSCEAIVGSSEPQACIDAFQGVQDAGASCTLDEECAGGWCDMRDACPGVCADAVAEDGSCASGEQCEAGTECIGDVCTLDPGPAQQSESCEDRACAYGLWCDWSGDSTCQARVAEGQSCERDEMCDHGLYCNNLGECAVPEIVTSAGEPCGGYDEGPFCSMADGLGCVMDFMTESWTTCEPLRQEGEDCIEYDEANSVALYYTCDPFAHLYCDTNFEAMTGTCLAKKGQGETCESGEECLSGDCDNNQCTDPNPGPCE